MLSLCLVELLRPQAWVRIHSGVNKMADSLEYMGVTIIKSNHMVTGNFGTTTIGDASYNLDFDDSEIKSIVWQSNAVAGAG